MPSTTEKQARFMRAVAHGWTPRHAKAPPVDVAKEFVAADQAAGMYEGGLAPMNDIIQRGDAPGLNFQEGGWVAPEGWRYGTEPISYAEARRLSGAGGVANMMAPYFHLSRAGWISQPDPDHPGDLDRTMWFPPETVGAAVAGTGSSSLTPGIDRPPAPDYDPTYGGPAANIDLEEVESRMRHGAGPRGRGGRGGPPGRGGGQPPPPRDIPGAIPPGRDDDGGLVPPVTPPYTPPDRRAGRDTVYSQALRAHRARVLASLGSAEGGVVRGYQEGGEVRPGHAEGPNPYDPKKRPASYAQWERKHHVDPPPPPPPEPEEEKGWLARLLEKKEASETRTERELEEMEQATGGYVHGYQEGGLASAMGQFQGMRQAMGPGANRFRAPPGGGVPPSIQSRMKPRMGGVPPRIDPRAMPPQMPGGGATTGQSSLPAHLQNIAGRYGALEQTMGGPGSPPPRMVPPTVRNLPVGMKDPRQRIAPPPGKRMPFGGRDPRAMPPRGGFPGRRPPMRIPPGVDPRGGPGVPPSDRMGPEGGPRVPPNLRGYMNRARMMNRPRRGIPGPAGAGGAPNRVGQSDQQGGLARALQRGTGRPPMSRRQGFYR